MKVQKEDLKKGKFKLTITIEPSELVKYFKSTYDDLSKDVKLQGFRPGKAPRKLAEESIGIARLLSEGLDLAVREEYYKAVTDEKLIPITSPKITISKYPSWGIEPSEIKDDLVFEAEIEVMPEVELKDFSKVSVKEKKIDEAKDEDVEKIMEHLKRQKATFAEVERGAKFGDRAEISYKGFLNKVQQDSMSAKNHPIILGEKTLIPGFEEEIVGMKKGDSKKFEITFPKDYHAKDFAGKKAEFEVEIIDLKQINLPIADDSFAADFGHGNMKDLTAAIKKSLKDEIESKHKQELESEVIEKVLPFLSVEIPEGLIDQEIDRLVADMKNQVEEKGIAFDKYLESMKKDLPALRKDLKQVAEKNIRIGFLLGKIIEQEKYDPQDPDSGKKALVYITSKVVK